jgi:hypothetical protein
LGADTLSVLRHYGAVSDEALDVLRANRVI